MPNRVFVKRHLHGSICKLYFRSIAMSILSSYPHSYLCFVVASSTIISVVIQKGGKHREEPGNNSGTNLGKTGKNPGKTPGRTREQLREEPGKKLLEKL